MEDEDASFEWLVFDAPENSAEVSGGPVVDLDGNALAIHTVLSPSSKQGYAIPIKLLQDLMASAPNEVRPFAQTQVASNTTDPVDPDAATTLEQPLPPQATVAPAWSAEDIETLYQETKEFDWNPQDVKQYAALQILAGKLYQASNLIDSQEGTAEQRSEAQKAAKEALDKLNAIVWKNDDRPTNVNKLAVEELDKSFIGVYAYTKIISSTPPLAEFDNRALVLMQIIGHERYLLVPMSAQDERNRREGKRGCGRWRASRTADSLLDSRQRRGPCHLGRCGTGVSEFRLAGSLATQETQPLTEKHLTSTPPPLKKPANS